MSVSDLKGKRRPLVEGIATEAKQDEIIGNYTSRITTDSGYTYIGEATPGASTASAVWRISRVDSSGNELWCDSNTNFDNVWDNVLALTFG